MTFGTDRRSVLTGLGALGVAGCGPSPASEVDVTVFDLDLDLSALEARHGGRLGVCAYGRKGRIKWRGDERFLYCSTFKLFLAAATLQRAMAGAEPMSREIPIIAADLTPHAPTTGPAVGSTLTVEQLCQGMVELSDNPAANLLVRLMGGLEKWKAWYPMIGDTVTRVDRLEPQLNVEDGGKDTTTPLQAAANLARLFPGPGAVSPLRADARALLEGWLKASPTGPNRIKAGVPNGFQVAHKTGASGAGHANDIGVIYPPSGDPIVLAIYFHATSASTPAQRDAVIADATRIALAALGHGEAA